MGFSRLTDEASTSTAENGTETAGNNASVVSRMSLVFTGLWTYGPGVVMRTRDIVRVPPSRDT